MTAQGAARGARPQPRESHCSVPLAPGLLPGQCSLPPAQGGSCKHWVRAEDSTAAIPHSPSSPPSPVPAAPQGCGPWALAARGGIRISGKKWGDCFPYCENKVFEPGEISLSHEHTEALRAWPGKANRGPHPPWPRAASPCQAEGRGSGRSMALERGGCDTEPENRPPPPSCCFLPQLMAPFSFLFIPGSLFQGDTHTALTSSFLLLSP